MLACARPPRSVERAMNEATIEHLMSKIALKTQKNIELLLVSRRSYARSCCRVPRVCSVRGHECAVSVATGAQCPRPRVRSVRARECRRPRAGSCFESEEACHYLFLLMFIVLEFCYVITNIW